MIKEKKCLPIFLSDTKNTHCFDINQYWNFIFTDLTFSHRWWCIIIFLSPNYENPSSYLIYFFYFHWVAYSKFFLQFFFFNQLGFLDNRYNEMQLPSNWFNFFMLRHRDFQTSWRILKSCNEEILFVSVFKYL